MTAALIILLCLSVDIPPFLCHGPEVQTILRERENTSPLSMKPSRATNATGTAMCLFLFLVCVFAVAQQITSLHN